MFKKKKQITGPIKNPKNLKMEKKELWRIAFNKLVELDPEGMNCEIYIDTIDGYAAHLFEEGVGMDDFRRGVEDMVKSVTDEIKENNKLR